MQTFTVYSNNIQARLDPLFYSQPLLDFYRRARFSLEKLSDLTLYLKSGFAAGKADQDDVSKYIIQIRPTNIDEDGFLYFDKNIYIKQEVADRKKSDLLRKGEVLFNNTNSQELVGKTAFFNLDENYLCSNHITRVVVNNSKILPEYLWLVLNLYQQNKVFFNICTNWNNQSGVNIDLLKTLSIPLPRFDKQKEIVELFTNLYRQKQQKDKEAKKLLNTIDDYVRKQLGIDYQEPKEEKIYTVNSQDLENNRQDPYYYNPKFVSLAQAISENLKMASLSEISEDVFNGNTPAKENYRDEGKPIVKVSCLKKNRIEWSNLAYAKDKKLNKYLKNNDILFLSSAHQAEYLGKNPCLIKIPESLQGTDITFVGELICIRPNTNKINPYYLLAVLRLDEYHQLINREKRGQTSHIYPEDLRKIKLPLVAREKQDKIAQEFKKQLNQIEDLKNEASNLLEEAKKQVEAMILN